MKKHTHTHTLLAGLLFAGFSTAACANLVLHYTFDEGSGFSADSSVNASGDNQLGFIGSAGWDTGQAGFGGALSLTAAGDAAVANNPASWSPTLWGGTSANLTMTMWVNLQPSSSNAPVLMGAQDTITFRHQGIIRADAPALTAGGFVRSVDSTSTIQTPRAATAIGTGWHHLAMTFDGTAGNMKYYMDGTELADATDAAWNGWGPSTDLSESGVGHIGFSVTGLYDDVRIYDTVLSLSEVNQSMIPIQVPEPSSSSLIGLGGLALILRRRK